MTFIGSLLAQEGPETGRVIHLWVDPHYGNDTLAASNALDSNPSCSGGANGCISGECLPNDVTDPHQPGEVLLHAPWAFRTVTAAIAYIPTLPVTSSLTGARWDYAVIHCLPGLYAARSQQGNSGGLVYDTATDQYYHRSNGQVANGETFPIRIPDRVSIQGASALNTVFFGNYVTTIPPIADVHCFQYGTPGAKPSTGYGSFINSVAICGFRWGGFSMTANRVGCAVYMGRDVETQPTISNNFIYCNEVGIVMDAPYQDGTITDWHKPVIVNNTIAWNRCGVWNGMSEATGTSYGRGAPVQFNNIIDCSPPFPVATDIVSRNTNIVSNVMAFGTTCFEGMVAGDLLIATTGGTSPATNQNFNAYQGPGRYNTGVGIGSLPATYRRPGSVAPPAPTIDITNHAGDGQPPVGVIPRGLVFLRDAMFAYSQYYSAGSTAFDRSPHDWRLSPSVATSSQTPAQGGRNYLIDRGWCPNAAGTWAFPVTMQNGSVLLDAPGSILSTAGFPHDLWRYDAEGFGNPRIHDHPAYPSVSIGGVPSGPIDIGADECGESIVGGYRMMTKRFMTLSASDQTFQPNGLSSMDNKYYFRFGLPAASTPAAPVLSHTLRPRYSPISNSPLVLWEVPGYDFRWYSTGWWYAATMVDTVPHLLPDIHPYWIGPLAGAASNPIWQADRTSPTTCGSPLYNPLLFIDPSESVINPTGTHLPYGLYLWLQNAIANAQPQDLYGGTHFSVTKPFVTTSFDDWMRPRDTPTSTGYYDTFVQTSSAMRRYSCEHQFAPWSGTAAARNLQSFTVYTRAQ
ncbi:MAG: hypothetical protein H6832_02200 [Planctomycetes bacterium]|nr:hypothetical protein [Planctomycetota bacterium]